MDNKFIDVSLNDSILNQLGYITTQEDYEKYLIKDEENIFELNIPVTYNFDGQNYRITKIDNEAFKDYEELQSITIPDTVTEIGESAFENCRALEKINIPNSVTKIGNSAFAYCESLKSVNIPNSVTYIGKKAFWGTSLTNVTIPNGVTQICLL